MTHIIGMKGARGKWHIITTADIIMLVKLAMENNWTISMIVSKCKIFLYVLLGYSSILQRHSSLRPNAKEVNFDD